MAYITGVHPGSENQLFEHWWQWVLLAAWICSILLGSGFIAFVLVNKLRAYLKRKPETSEALREKIRVHLQKYAISRSSSVSSLETLRKKKPESLGIYLGTFNQEDFSVQARTLSKQDLIVLDPFQPNVLPFLADLFGDPDRPSYVLGRLDLGVLLKISSQTLYSQKIYLSCVDTILGAILAQLRDPSGSSNGFTGVLLANWDVLPTSILHELSDVTLEIGLEVFLEASAPDFITDMQVLESKSISGLIIRNGIIQANGERQDCFDMEALQMTVKAFVTQSCIRNFTVLAWETIDDDVVISHAVLKRTFNWCKFYNLVPWIGPKRALLDATAEIIPCEPLSAFAWLKEPRVMKLHGIWKSQKAVHKPDHRQSTIGKLADMVPSLTAAQEDCSCIHDNSLGSSAILDSSAINDLEWFNLRDAVLCDPLCMSPVGNTYNELGCFPVGLDLSLEDYQEIVYSQRNLRKLELLDVISPAQLHEYGVLFGTFTATGRLSSDVMEFDGPKVQDVVLELARNLSTSPEDGSEGVRVFLGLHSGLQRTVEKQFWGVSHSHSVNTVEIYISKNVEDIPGTLLHTYLSWRGLTRRQCLAAELSFARWNRTLVSPHNLPPRIAQDMEMLSPEEGLSLLQRISRALGAESDALLCGMTTAIMEKLVDIPVFTHLKQQNTIGYLRGDISVEEMLQTRLQWHCQCKRQHPSLEIANVVFREVEQTITQALKDGNDPDLRTITDSLSYLLQSSALSAIGDLFVLTVFTTMRKLALEEVYIEVTDRNPLFNDQADQAAAFAELFALGSGCESYFDVTPSQFGELLSKKFSEYYSSPEHQPPQLKEKMAGLRTAYSEAQIDVDPSYKPRQMPAFQRFTFLSVFAIPALIDILLLTTTGHGLYLSGLTQTMTFMTHEEQHSATTALMISLLLSGAIGTWITCGGTYYLSSMAFSAMNYFVVTRLLGGFAFTLGVGIVGFVAFVCTGTLHAAIVFFLYLIVLTTYLSLLAALANYQFTGSAFQSGRGVIICCIPILFVSPLTTVFIPGHDIIIYLSVLYIFVLCLLLGVRWTGSRWTTWYQQIDLVTDKQLRNWYLEERADSSEDDLEKLSDPAVLRFARQSLLHEVTVEQRKNIFSSKTSDPLVAKLVKSFEATEFLIDWYCRFSGLPRPILYSSAWNNQTKVALFSLQKSQLGIRFHNGFLHWRQAGDEIGCTVLYFVLALLDKWISLVDGGQLVGLANADITLTMPVGFGLAYYLIGAVLLDCNGHKLHKLAGRRVEEIVPTDGDIAHAAKVKCMNRRRLYWSTLFRFLCWHVWGLAVTTTLIWLFSSTDGSIGTKIFFSYVWAYTGLLWYQYTKIFSGPHALKPLIIAVVLGLVLGFVLDHKFPKWIYSDIIALGVATWTVAILSLRGGKIVGPPDDLPLPSKSTTGLYGKYSRPGPDPAWSQAELQSLYEQLSDVSDKEKLLVDPSSPFGTHVTLILDQATHANISELAQKAFPEIKTLLQLTKRLFQERIMQVELLSDTHFPPTDKNMRAISLLGDTSVRLLVSCETKQVQRNQDPLQSFYWDVAELLIQSVAERYLGYSTHDALLAQNLLFNSSVWNEGIAGPDILESHLNLYTRSDNLNDHLASLKHEVLHNLCLGFDFNNESESLPEVIRKFIINRCLGKSGQFTEEQSDILNAKVNHTPGLHFETYVARCNYAAFLGGRVLNIASSRANMDKHSQHGSHSTSFSNVPQQGSDNTPVPWKTVSILLKHATPPKYTIYDKFLKYSGAVYHYAGTICKFFSIAFVADPEYQRELKCTFERGNQLVYKPATVLLLAIWMWARWIQVLLLPYFLFYRRPNVVATWKNIQGMEVRIKRRRVVIRNIEGVLTGFVQQVDDGTFRLLQYRGDHKTEPSTNTDLVAINMYTTNMTLIRRVELEKGNTVNDYLYEYHLAEPGAAKRLSRADFLTSPISRRGVAGRDALQNVSYNSKGQIESGSYMKDGNMIRFQYHYQKTPKYAGALLRAEFVLPHLSCTVSWCAPPRRKPERLESWIPNSQVTEATFVVGADVWESKYFYDHKFHPTIVTTLNGQRVETPALILYDYLDVLKRPKQASFLHDNPLFGFSSIKTWSFTRWLGLNTRRYPVSTPEARSLLWKAWKDDPAFDGVIVRWLDEKLLRREPMLKPYWRKRDTGKLDSAEAYLERNRDAIMARMDLDNTVSSMTPLAIKINDLYSFGQGGDACSMTRSNLIAQEEDETALHVIAIDTGTWPNEGGGVTGCRSDVINNLRTIKWHMVSESANDFGIPKRQIERNVHSLKIIPVWGLDLMTPTHGLFANRLDSEVDYLARHTTLLDVERSFVPILKALIGGARALDFSISDVKQTTRALVNLNNYFENGRNWSAVWGSDVVKSAWRQLWLSQTAQNAHPSSKWFKTELPTLSQLDQALELWSRYLFIYSIPIPEKMPAVFQASHHSVSASYGIVCKLKRGCTLQIWDHAISWRETNLYLSSALCPLSPFVRNSLLGLMRFSSVLTLHHADTILPCADFFNPGWEVEIGTCRGVIENRNTFRRKIDPVVNGITHMERFAPVKEIKTTVPTVTMLSHIWYAKDIKTALLSADIIVNKWGFKDYKLEIYGAIDKTPSYTTSCQEIIATKSLRDNVTLMGEANPIDVLERTWAFLNSSISEGLPLALGEAALTGAPVICTDVGASLRVLTNPVDGSCYSAVVAPNDAHAMARAQIKLLALLEEWDQYSDPSLSIPSNTSNTTSSTQTIAINTKDASFPNIPTENDIIRITKRMYEQSPARRRLGMRTREIVQKSFSGERYLREHEQMLWVGKARRDMVLPRNLRPSCRNETPVEVRILDLVGSNEQRAGRKSEERKVRAERGLSGLSLPASGEVVGLTLSAMTRSQGTSLRTSGGSEAWGGRRLAGGGVRFMGKEKGREVGGVRIVGEHEDVGQSSRGNSREGEGEDVGLKRGGTSVIVNPVLVDIV